MSKNKIESMINFKYFVKLRKTKRKTPTEFFSSFFSSQIPKKQQGRKFRMNIFQYKDLNQESTEELLINELKKPIINETNIFEISSSKINNILNNSINHESMERNINTMLSILTKNKECLRYFIFNSLNEKHIRLLSAFSTHEHYSKGSCIYTNNSKPNACYLIIRGKVSLKTLNPDKIRNEIYKNNLKFLSIFRKIEVDDKFNGRYADNDDDDKISLDNYVSKTNIITNQQDDNIILINSPIKQKNMKKMFRRSFTKDFNLFKKILNQSPQKLVEDKILIKNLTELQRNLSCEIKSFTAGNFFGEWDMILDKPHPETAYAEENTDLLVLNKKYFDKYFLKHILKIDNERRLFLTKRIGFLHVNNVINLKPEFHDKDKIIYTQFDYAKEFYIIYKGRGALKQIKNNNCKKKSEVIFHKNDMKTLCIVDRGCVVGLESCKDGGKKYDNNFVIIEDNTILYRIPMKGVNEDNNYLKRKNRLQLKKELGSLYLAQNDILPKTNAERKKLTKDELKSKKKEDKINNIFFDSKDYYWRTILNKKRMNMKINTFNNLYDLYKNISNSTNKKIINKINFRKTISTEWYPNKRRSHTRNSNFKFLTLANKIPKEIAMNSSFHEKEEQSKKSVNNTKNILNSFNSVSLFSNNYSEHQHLKSNLYYLKSNYEKYKEKIINLNNKKYMTLKTFQMTNYLNEEKNQQEKNSTRFNSFDNHNFDNNNNINKKNNLLKVYKKTKLIKNPNNIFVDKYIQLTAKISKENNINYNSGYFKMPLIGLNRKNDLI